MTTTIHTRRGLIACDSIPLGIYDDAGTTLCVGDLWPAKLSNAMNINFQCFGGPGDRITVGAAANTDFSIRFGAQGLNTQRGVEGPRAFIIAAGTNDFTGADTYFTTNASCWSYIDDLKWLAQWGKSNGYPTLIIPPLNRFDAYATASVTHPDGARTLADYQNFAVEIAELVGVPFILPSAFGLTAADHAADGLHLRSSGHEKVFLVTEAALCAMRVTP